MYTTYSNLNIGIPNYFVCTNFIPDENYEPDTFYDRDFSHKVCTMLYIVKINDNDQSAKYLTIEKSTKINLHISNIFHAILSSNNRYYILAICSKKENDVYILIWDIIKNEIKYFKLILERYYQCKISISPDNKYLCVFDGINIYLYELNKFLLNGFNFYINKVKEFLFNSYIESPDIFKCNSVFNYHPYNGEKSTIFMLTSDIILYINYNYTNTKFKRLQTYNIKTKEKRMYRDVDYLSTDKSFIVQYFTHSKITNLITGEEKSIIKKNIPKTSGTVYIFDDKNIYVQSEFYNHYYPTENQDKSNKESYKAFDIITGLETKNLCYNRNYKLLRLSGNIINCLTLNMKFNTNSINLEYITQKDTDVDFSTYPMVFFDKIVDLRAIYKFIPSIRVLATSGSRQYPDNVPNLVIVNIIEQFLITNGYNKNSLQVANRIYKYLINEISIKNLEILENDLYALLM